jgi:hypothetical protein
MLTKFAEIQLQSTLILTNRIVFVFGLVYLFDISRAVLRVGRARLPPRVSHFHVAMHEIRRTGPA